LRLRRVSLSSRLIGLLHHSEYEITANAKGLALVWVMVQVLAKALGLVMVPAPALAVEACDTNMEH